MPAPATPVTVVTAPTGIRTPTPFRLFRRALSTSIWGRGEAAGQPFLEVPAGERVALLERLALNEQQPQTEGERFFKELKGWTARGYYTSRIGIHDELEYKGNTLLMEFVGTDPATLPGIGPVED